VEAIQNRGLSVAGIVLNGYASEPTRVEDWEELIPGTIPADSSRTNPLLIERFADVPVIGTLPMTDEDIVFEEYVNVKRILNALKK
jgi:dethiobiotin synthetase